ncbi:MAG: hypothetical protein IJ708_09635 [Clostridia bacterium]|nr:hypothetical protein [Clostridia bacterium]MBR2287783.1 hypothetical protein [Clostridia bacterium]
MKKSPAWRLLFYTFVSLRHLPSFPEAPLSVLRQAVEAYTVNSPQKNLKEKMVIPLYWLALTWRQIL